MKQSSEVFTIEDEYIPDFFEEKLEKNNENFDESDSVAINQELKKFDDYSHDNTLQDYEEYEVIKSYKPKNKISKQGKEFKEIVQNQFDYTPANETYIFQRSKTKNIVANKVRSRILIYCCAFIAILLSTLCVVNVVNMTTTNLYNAQKQAEISGIDKDLSKSEETIEDIENEIKDEANKSSYITSDKANSYSILLLQKKKIISYERQTNLFDRICNFISNLFGG